MNSPKKRSKILSSLVAVLLAMALLPLLVVSWRLITINRETLAANQRALQLQVAQSRAREVEVFVRSYFDRTAGFARALELGAPARLAVPAEHLRGPLNRDPNLLAIAVVPADGTYTSASRPDRLPAEALEPLLEEAVTAAAVDGSYLGSPRILGQSFLPITVMADAVRAGGATIGIVVTVVDMDSALRFVAPDGASRTTAEALSGDAMLFYVVDDKGVAVAHPDQQTVLEGRSLRASPLVDEWVERGRQVRDVTRDFDERIGDRDLGLLGALAAADLPGGRRLGVATVVNRDVAFASVDRMAAQTLYASLVAAVIALFVAVLFAGYLANPIRDLARGARAIADGDFSHRIRIWSNNEVGQLAEDFNRMADKVQALVDELRTAADTNKSLFVGTIRALAEAIDGKDPYTRGHSERVGEYSAAIAAEMGLPEEEVEKFRIGGLMHDLGKIGIEDKILRKPAPLTDEEYQIMKEHPEKGARIMSAIPQMREYISGMRFHHETLDGKGYPLGLAGEQIPLMARIVSVADTFDAMTTNRPYQKQMELDHVLDRIRSFVGTRYDAKVVDALVAACQNGRIKVRRAAPVGARVPKAG